MRIVIENTSSPGASFTPNTNNVLLKIDEWIIENKGEVISFRDFRRRLQSEKGINDNNNRNIYPLLKSGGLVNYEARESLCVDDFFTREGQAYIRVLKSIVLIEESNTFGNEQKEEASKRFEAIKNEIIYNALLNIMNCVELNYVEPFRDMILFLLAFKQISKVEYAYLLFLKQSVETEEALRIIQPEIELLRAGELTIDVAVSVRNDIDLRKEMNSDKREEPLSFLTSYTYFTSLLKQAGLVYKKNGYFCLYEDKESHMKNLGGSDNG